MLLAARVIGRSRLYAIRKPGDQTLPVQLKDKAIVRCSIVSQPARVSFDTNPNILTRISWSSGTPRRILSRQERTGAQPNSREAHCRGAKTPSLTSRNPPGRHCPAVSGRAAQRLCLLQQLRNPVEAFRVLAPGGWPLRGFQEWPLRRRTRRLRHRVPDRRQYVWPPGRRHRGSARSPDRRRRPFEHRLARDTDGRDGS